MNWHFPQYVCSAHSLILCFPGMLLRYCLSDFEMAPFAHIINGITFAFIIIIVVVVVVVDLLTRVSYAEMAEWTRV